MKGGWDATPKETTAYAEARKFGSSDPWCRDGSSMQQTMALVYHTHGRDLDVEVEEDWSQAQKDVCTKESLKVSLKTVRLQ